MSSAHPFYSCKKYVDLYKHKGLPLDLVATPCNPIQYAMMLSIAENGNTAPSMDELTHCRQCDYTECNVKHQFTAAK
eukprot:6201559-Ditylum_brightwellii.AAC.1